MIIQTSTNTMDDMTDFQKEYLEKLKAEEKKELSNNSGTINSFKNFMAKKGIHLSDENFKFYQTTGIVVTYPNIISFLSPILISDKEGLMDFNNLCKNFEKRSFINGYLYGECFMLMAHTYFRRGFHEINSYAPRFIDLFWKYKDCNVESYIAIDTDRVRINVDDSMYMEKDFWHGARFNRNIESIPDGIVKLRPPMDLEASVISLFFDSAYTLDIKWITKGSIKTFQAEEFKTEKITLQKDGKVYYPVRYVHAEYDTEKGHFRHFDGAIHFYSESEYYSRRDSDFNYNKKSDSHIKTLSQKLFKLNGEVSVDTWIEFSSHFLTGNPLVFEYFEGKYPVYIDEVFEKLRRRNNKDS